jgi:hypothetical protein
MAHPGEVAPSSLWPSSFRPACTVADSFGDSMGYPRSFACVSQSKTRMPISSGTDIHQQLQDAREEDTLA